MSRRVFCVAMAILLVALMAIGCGGNGSKSGGLEYRDLGIRLTAYDSETGRPLFKGAESYFSAVQHSSAEGVEIEIVAKQGIDASNMWVDLTYNPEYLNPLRIDRGEELADNAIFLDVRHIKGTIPLVAAMTDDSVFEGGTFARVHFASEAFSIEEKGLFIINPEVPANLLFANEVDGIRATWETSNMGDYNGDGRVNGNDVFMIALHFRDVPSIDGGVTVCIDGDSSDRIDGGDIFPIAIHFQHEVQGYQIERAVNELGPYSPVASPFLINDGNEFYTDDPVCKALNGTWDFLDDNNGQGLDDGFYFYRMRVVDFTMQSLVVGDPVSILRGPVVYPLAPENVEVTDGWYENIIEWTIPDDETITGFNVYRMYTIPDGEDPPGFTETPYDFGKPINDELIPLNEDPLDLAYFMIDRDAPDAEPEQTNLFRNAEYYYVVKSYNSFLVESENGVESEAGPGYPFNATVITDTGNSRVVVAGLNTHTNHVPAEQIIWDSSVDTLLTFDGTAEEWIPLDPPGLSNPTMARFFPNVTGDDNELSHMVICDNGNDRVIWINWTSFPSPFCWAVVDMATPFGVDIDDHVPGQADPNYYMSSGNNFPDDFPDDLGNVILWNQAEGAENPFEIFRYPLSIYSIEYVEELSHPDTLDDAEDGDDPDYTGPALVMAQSQPGMEGETPVINVVELSTDFWLTDPYNFLQWEGPIMETQYIGAAGAGSAGMLSFHPGIGGTDPEFIGLDFDKTTEEVDAEWFWWQLDPETILQINSGVSSFPRGANFVGMNPNAVNLCWSDGLIWTVIIDQSVFIYQADAVGLGLNTPTYSSWMIKPDWIP